MQSLSEQRQEVYKNPNLALCSSLALYVLVEKTPRPDNPHCVRYGCTELKGAEGILLFVSPLDAVIMCRSFNSEGGKFEVCPFETIDPRRFILNRDCWLSLHLCYGFGAQGGKLILDEYGSPSGLVYRLHLQFKPEDIEEHIHLGFDKNITGWLERVQRAIGLPDYPSLVHELSRSSMPELELTASTALQAVSYIHLECYEPTQPAQCAVFDPVEAQWCFVDTDII